MSNIIRLKDSDKIIAGLKKTGHKITLVGGCFDILHVGHIKFLEASKKTSDFLVVLLESDNKVSLLKGKNRPLFSQKERARVLINIKPVDFVILLPDIYKDSDYINIISKMRPDYISVTQNDPYMDKKKAQTLQIGARLVIIPYIKTHSSSKLAILMGVD